MANELQQYINGAIVKYEIKVNDKYLKENILALEELKMKNKKQQVVIRNINVYLNKEQEKVWNELPSLYTHSQRVQHFINYYIVNKRKKDNENK